MLYCILFNNIVMRLPANYEYCFCGFQASWLCNLNGVCTASRNAIWQFLLITTPILNLVKISSLSVSLAGHCSPLFLMCGLKEWSGVQPTKAPSEFLAACVSFWSQCT